MPCHESFMAHIGCGAYWAGRAIARPLFGPNVQAILIALPLFAVLLLRNLKKMHLHCTAVGPKPNLLSPDAVYDQKMHQK